MLSCHCHKHCMEPRRLAPGADLCHAALCSVAFVCVCPLSLRGLVIATAKKAHFKVVWVDTWPLAWRKTSIFWKSRNTFVSCQDQLLKLNFKNPFFFQIQIFICTSKVIIHLNFKKSNSNVGSCGLFSEKGCQWQIGHPLNAAKWPWARLRTLNCSRWACRHLLWQQPPTGV